MWGCFFGVLFWSVLAFRSGSQMVPVPVCGVCGGMQESGGRAPFSCMPPAGMMFRRVWFPGFAVWLLPPPAGGEECCGEEAEECSGCGGGGFDEGR